MGDVASLELCKELYEVSGWDDTERKWATGLPRDPATVVTTLRFDSQFEAPAYSAGYLLRKLPGELATTKIEHEWYIAQFYKERGKAPLEAVSDTPEDALCKLSIELFKSKVLL